ncbi:hypothetical protein MTO96_031979 [Rhipicephalus appendiculatus]
MAQEETPAPKKRALSSTVRAQAKTPPKAGTRAVLGLDLRKALDSVRHAAIASNLAAINPGERTYKYVFDFL